MMFASKMPSLRIDQSELKCKNGCDYFGNTQWQGYCSKCHREKMQKQRQTEKSSNSSSTLPRPDQKRPDRGIKLTSHSSFSRFEEKKLRQSETMKKPNLLKFTVFKKSNTEDHDHASERRSSEFKVPAMVNEGMKRDFRARFPSLPTQVDKDSRLFVHSLIMYVMKYANVLTVDELSEKVQSQYQRFMRHMETSIHFSSVDADMREVLMDFVEKHAMTYLHELPGVVFSPSGTDDERLDRAMSDRIQQLSWVSEKHLECKLDRNDAHCRNVLYKAISELLAMDGSCSPGGKLSRARRAGRHALALCRSAPASADDLLPALIFTVLKANPPRLHSNINFVTRFCNAQRLMTGEAGYYFTNLCCAVSFIENLTAESLNMDKKEFECYMAMPASIGGSAWAAALSLCGAAREAEEQRLATEQLLARSRQLTEKSNALATNALTFEEQITNKVKDVLAKTPLEITPRRELPRFGKFKEIVPSPLVDLDINTTEPAPTDHNLTEVLQKEQTLPEISEPAIEKITLTNEEPLEKVSPSKSPQLWELRQANSLELLTPSPLGFTPFDSRSIDELMTPDDFSVDQLAPGLGNINYDIDLSDFSAENSIAEDSPKPKDPFSPKLPKTQLPFDPFAPQSSTMNPVLEAFDQFSLVDSKNVVSDPFELVSRFDPFSPVASGTPVPLPKTNFTSVNLPAVPFSPMDFGKNAEAKYVDPFSPLPKQGSSSILDDSNSPTAACLLPSPLQPQSSGKPT